MTNTAKYENRNDLPEGTVILVPKDMKEKVHKYHQEPQTCCAAIAVSGHGSSIIARTLPVEVIPDLRFGPSKSKEKALKLDRNGIPTVVSLSGFIRKMSGETQKIVEGLFEGE